MINDNYLISQNLNSDMLFVFKMYLITLFLQVFFQIILKILKILVFKLNIENRKHLKQYTYSWICIHILILQFRI